MADLVAKAAMTPTGDEASRWARYAGSYRTPEWGVIDLDGPADRFVVDAGVPYFDADDDTGSLVRHRLVEVERGLFLADNGETLDLRGHVPTWRNLRLVRVSGGPSRSQWAIVGTAALLAVTWLVAALARTFRRTAAAGRSLAAQRAAGRRWRTVTAAFAGATALVVLATVTILVWKPRLVDAGFLGWLDLSFARRLALHLPLAVVVLGAPTVALVASGWIGRWWSRAVRLEYAGLAVAAVALAALLAGWGLIGWGITS